MKAASVGIGVFMGIVPIWGLQMAVAIALAFVLRLNKALVILAANISIPPMIPLILYASHEFGAVWLGENAQSLKFDSGLSLEVVRQHLTQYIAGAITLAIVAGSFFAFLTYGVLKIYKRVRRVDL